jgi:hypothetical protein
VDADPHPKGHGVSTGQLDRKQRTEERAHVRDLHHHGRVRVFLGLPRAFSPVLIGKAENWVRETKTNVSVMGINRPST